MKHKSKKIIESDIQDRHRLKAKKLLADEDYVQDMMEYESLGLWGRKREAIAEEKSRILKSLPKELPGTITPDSPYYKNILRLKELDLEENQFEFRRAEIRNKHKEKQPYPYALDELRDIAEGKSRFLLEEEKVVDIVRLREPKYKPVDPETLSKEDLDYCPNHSEIVDDGLRDDEGYLYFKIKPDESKIIIHHLIDALLNIYGDKEKKKSRFRKEQVDALTIYDERRLRKSFKQIAREQGIKEPAAKKQFYKAYEIRYRKKYNPAEYEKPEIRKEYLKRTCDTCNQKSTCKDPCPDVIDFVEQDNKPYQREYISNKIS